MEATAIQSVEKNITMVALANVQPSNYNPRKNFDETSLVELSESIRQQGVLQPIGVRPIEDNRFEIVFGEQELFWGIDTDYIETPIREISVDNAERFTWYDGWKTLVLRGNDENGLDWEFSPEDIGKTVFLTREAAEAALKEREAEHER